jgi:hypothetical protein
MCSLWRACDYWYICNQKYDRPTGATNFLVAAWKITAKFLILQMQIFADFRQAIASSNAGGASRTWFFRGGRGSE